MMKKATSLIVKQLPFIEKILQSGESVNRTEDSSVKLNEVEKTFLQLVLFFENPEKENFKIASLYKHLDDEWLELALQAIYVFFSEDTYLMKTSTFSVIKENDAYKNQTQFAQYLKSNGLQYDRSKINVYLKRGIIPKPDLEIAGSKYWKGSTCEAFLKKEQARTKQ